MWVFAVFGCLAAAALVASQVVRRRDIRRRHEEAQRLTLQARRHHDRERRQADLTDGGTGDLRSDVPRDAHGDVPTQREVAEERERHRSRDS
jgi:hypothetical protein